MKEIELYKYLIGKNDSLEHKWLPLWVHSVDTYHVMQYLLTNWLTGGTLHAVTNRLSARQITQLALFLSIFHDYGKASMTFQAKITDNAEELHRIHDLVGLNTPQANDPELRGGKEMPHGIAGEIMLLLKGCPASLAAIVGAHHGRPWDNGPRVSDDIEDLLEDGDQEIYKNFNYGLRLWGGKKRREKWIEAQDAFYDWALSVSEIDNIRDLPEVDDTVAVILAGSIVMADWLASNEKYFPLIEYSDSSPEDMDNRAERAIKLISLPPAWRPAFKKDYQTLSKNRFGFYPNEIQGNMVEALIGCSEPGLFILEAPMGIGKTEAALLAAEEFSDNRATGMAFALPTQATANGIFTRILEWGEKQTDQNALSIRLAHGMAALNEDYASLIDDEKHAECVVDDYDNTRLIVHDFFQGSKQALLADFVVGTIDQVLMAALKQKHFMLRHLGLCGKVVIIDECHAYDTYMNEYLERTLQWLGAYRTPVIMLSATLPYERRSALIDAYLGNSRSENNDPWRKALAYPLLTWTDGETVFQKELEYHGGTRDIEIRALDCSDTEQEEIQSVIEILRENLQDGGCAAVVLNTVNRAQKMAVQIEKAFPEKHILLLHSRYISDDRTEYEKELLRCVGKHSTKAERDGFIVVGTQVIEQSLDFDVDFMVTDLCPMDLLLQRIGRLHRHSVHDCFQPERLKQAKCYVLGMGEAIEKGSEVVYGGYLLMRTKYFLTQKISLPADIASLVQKVYDENYELENAPTGYSEARLEHFRKRNKARKDADAFRLIPPGKEKTINRFLEASSLADEEQASAQVRDGDAGIEAIVLFSSKDGLTRAPWKYEDSFDPSICPNAADCRAISNQRIRFPVWVKGEMPVEELAMPIEWEKSPWLKGRHLLIFDESGMTVKRDLIIKYDHHYGLSVERKERRG